MSDPYAIPEPELPLPECHADGEAPEGYDPEDSLCQNCKDKFTCLPNAVAGGLIQIGINADREVQSVLDRLKPYDWAVARMAERTDLVDAEEEIPPALSPHFKDEEEEPESAEEPETEEPAQVEQPTQEEPTPQPEKEEKMAKKKAAKKKKKLKPKTFERVAKKKKAAKKASKKSTTPAPMVPLGEVEVAGKGKVKPPVKAKPTKPKPLAKAKAAKKAPKKSKPNGERQVARSDSSKLLPAPRSVTKEEMVLQLEGPSDGSGGPKVKLGVPGLRIGFGFQLVRKTRSGEEFIVTVTEQGYMYDDKLYATLSAAAQNASRTFCRSGNDWFSLVNTKCTSVRDEKGRVIATNGVMVQVD